jgi:hypothetical protein
METAAVVKNDLGDKGSGRAEECARYEVGHYTARYAA